MRIGILSMQRIVNAGSFLQAYALKTIVEQIAGGGTEFIDFVNPLQEKRNQTNPLVNLLKRIKHLLLPKYHSVEKMKKRKKKFLKEWVYSLSELGLSEQYRDACGRYDLVIIGSDEVFNIIQFHERGKEFPWLLLGENIQTNRLITYAASCGQTTVETIGQIEDVNHYKNLVSRFNALSARDQITYNIMKTFGRVCPAIHVDPVLLLQQFPRDDTYRKLTFPYLVVYAYPGRISFADEIEAIRSYAKEKKIKIVSINFPQPWVKEHVAASPFNTLRYFQDAKCVITDTFHGVVFSIRSNTPFAVFIRPSNSNKLGFLLEQFELSGRQVKSYSTFGKVMDIPINFDRINQMIDEEREKAINYLKEEIEKVKSA